MFQANNNNSYESSASLSPGTTASSAGGGGPSVSYVLAKDGRNAELKELRSDDGRFRFVVEDSGSVVLYRESDAIWAVYSGLAAGNPRSLDRVKMVLQSDGDLIVLHDRLGLIFSSGTSECGPSPYRLAMHNDGNCALYDGTGTERWSTKTRGWG